MDAKNEKMGWWWRRRIPSRGASALPPNICVHTQKVFVWVVFGSSHQVDGETEVCGMTPAMTEALSGTCLEHLGLRFLFISLLRCCSTCGKNPQLWKNPKSWEAALETRTHPNAPPQLARLDPPFVVASESKKLQVQSGRRRRRSTTRIHGWTYSRYFGTRLLYIHRQFLGIG